MASGDVLISGPAWRGELQRALRAQGLVIIGCESGSLGRGDDTAVREVLARYRLSTLTMTIDALLPTRPGAPGDDAELRRWSTGLAAAVEWLVAHGEAPWRPIGLLGEGIPAAAALRLAAERPDRVAAVVVCSGRTDLASSALARVHAATLLLVGAADADALAVNRDAIVQLQGVRRLEAIPGASGRFVEPGALDTVAHLAGTWLRDHLSAAAPS